LATGDVGGVAVPVRADGYAVNAGVDVARFDADAVPTDEVGVVVGLGLGPPVPPVVLVGVRAVVLRLVGVPVGRGDAENAVVGEGGAVGVSVALAVAAPPLETEVAVAVLVVAIAVRVAAPVSAGLAVAVLVADSRGSAGSVADGRGSAAGGVAVPPIVTPPEPFALR